MLELPNYDTWKTTPPDEPELVTCRECGEEGQMDEPCPGCDERLPLYCSNGRCGACDGCDQKADEEFDRMREGY